MERGLTGRGFTLIQFEDSNDIKCSIQESSAASDKHIWLGVDDPNPQILASNTPEGGNGWVPYQLPENVFMQTRMHIDRDKAKAIVAALTVFIETGEL